MLAVKLLLGIALQLLFWAMWVRFFVEIARSANPAWKPRRVILVIAEIALTVTDPIVKTVRRVIPTIRVGMIGLDLGWTASMILIVIAQGLVASIA